METSYVSTLIGSLRSDPKLGWPATAGLLLVGWRLYRFTLSSILYPRDPKEYPYWVPVIGVSLCRSEVWC